MRPTSAPAPAPAKHQEHRQSTAGAGAIFADIQRIKAKLVQRSYKAPLVLSFHIRGYKAPTKQSTRNTSTSTDKAKLQSTAGAIYRHSEDQSTAGAGVPES